MPKRGSGILNHDKENFLIAGRIPFSFERGILTFQS
jgi:hypothetical protein